MGRQRLGHETRPDLRAVPRGGGAGEGQEGREAPAAHQDLQRDEGHEEEGQAAASCSSTARVLPSLQAMKSETALTVKQVVRQPGPGHGGPGLNPRRCLDARRAEPSLRGPTPRSERLCLRPSPLSLSATCRRPELQKILARSGSGEPTCTSRRPSYRSRRSLCRASFSSPSAFQLFANQPF